MQSSEPTVEDSPLPEIYNEINNYITQHQTSLCASLESILHLLETLIVYPIQIMKNLLEAQCVIIRISYLRDVFLPSL